MKKAQSAIEFVILFSFMILIFAGFFIAIQTKIVDTTEKKDNVYLEEVNNIIVTEVALATRSPTDYHRLFFVPTHIKGKAFTLELVDNIEIIINYEGKEYVNFLENETIGPIYLGTNELHHLDGVLSIQGVLESHPEYKGLFLNINPEICYIYENTLIYDLSSETYKNMCEHMENMESGSTDLCAELFGLCEPDDDGGLPST